MATTNPSDLQQALSHLHMINVVKAVLLLLAGYLIARLLRSQLLRLFKERASQQQLMLIGRIVFVTIVSLFFISALQQLGFKLTVLLGAAGFLTLALGFASQTSVSNLISGLFLIFEQPFKIGESVEVSGITGEVLSIDPLSVKLKTFDNRFVRIPNDSLLKTVVINITRFPHRRFDFQLGVAYKEDLERVIQILLEVAERNESVLKKPEPKVYVKAFADSSMNLQFSVWAKREEFFTMKNSVHIAVKKAFDEQGIEIPFPQLVLNPMAGESSFSVKSDFVK